MFTPDSIIDSIQSTKKQIVTTFVKDDKFKEELIKLIDAQAACAKSSYKSSLAIAEAFYKNANDAIKKAADKGTFAGLTK
jgi:hypothetical protein